MHHVLKVFRPLFPILHIFAYYPLLLAITGGLILIVWGVLLGDYDAFHLIWNEDPYTGIVTGIIVAVILGEITLAVYLLDLHRYSFTQRIQGSRQLPQLPHGLGYYFSWWLLIAIYLLPLVNYDCQRPPLWFPIGMGVVPIASVVVAITIPWTYRRPDSVGIYMLMLISSGFVLMILLHTIMSDFYLWFLPATASILMVVTFITAVAGVVTYCAINRRWWFYPGVLCISFVPFVIPACRQEHRLPNMDYSNPVRLINYDELAKQPAAKFGQLDDREVLKTWHQRMMDRYGKPQPVVVVTCSGGASASAIYTADVLFTMEEQNPYFSDRIRVITGASGGMLGAAYFVTQLLPTGCIGKARSEPAYVKYIEAVQLIKEKKISNDEFKLREDEYRDLMVQCRIDFFNGLEADFLSPLVQKWVHKDAPLSTFGIVYPHTSNDRGLALERAWTKSMKGALDIPFRSLREYEERGEIPSLIFTPMVVEDGRQMIISNLDLSYMTETGRINDGNELLSMMGMEFFRLFPDANNFQLSTAVRMNASFPFFSPPAALPTDPVRHVVDAGYYDNYGMAAATKWLNNQKDFLFNPEYNPQADTGKDAAIDSDVILMRIRCFGYEKNSKIIPTKPEIDLYSKNNGIEPKDAVDRWKTTPQKNPTHIESGYYTLAAPFNALFAAWRANMVYRADERLGSYYVALREKNINLSDHLILCDTLKFCKEKPSREPSLDWTLSKLEIKLIHEDVFEKLKQPAQQAKYDHLRLTYAKPPTPTPSTIPQVVTPTQSQSDKDQLNLVKKPFALPDIKKK